MNRILWPLVIVLSIVSVYWILTGIGPKAIPVFKFSNFDSPEQLSEILYRQLNQKISMEKQIALGVTPGNPKEEKIAESFLQNLVQTQPEKITLISNGPVSFNLPGAVEFLDLATLPENQRRSRINEKILNGNRLVFVLEPFETPHFRKEALINVIDQNLKIKTLTFTFLKISYKHDQGGDFSSQCKAPGRDQHNLNPIACLVKLKNTRLEKSKKVTPDKLIGLAERQGQKDYMIYYR